MTLDRQPERSTPSLRRYTITVGALVTIIVTILGMRALVDDISDARQAGRQSESIGRVVAGSDAIASIRSEWVAARDLAATASGDFAGVSDLYATRAAGLLERTGLRAHERATEETDATLRSSPLPELRDSDLEARAESLASIRRRTVDGTITPVEIDLFYRHYVLRIEDAVEPDRSFLDATTLGTSRTALRQEDSINDLAAATGDLRYQLSVAIDTLITSRPVDWASLLRRVDSVDLRWRLVDETAIPGSRWRTAQGDLAAVLTTIETTPQRVATVSEALDPLLDARSTVRDIDRELLALSDDIAAGIVEDGLTHRAAAQRRSGVSAALVGLLLSVIAIGVWRIGRDIVRPLRAAATTAQRVSHGELEVARLTPAGPAEVRAVAATLDDLLTTIGTIERQSIAMARGETNHPVLLEQLPGKLGATLEQSIGAWRDTTARLEHEVSHDPLTALGSRRLFLQEAETRLAERSGTVLIASLDRFKGVNDTAGQVGGDLALAAIAAQLGDALEDEDVVTARLGSDEFAILTAERSVIETQRLAEIVARAVGLPVSVDGRSYKVTATVGLASGPNAEQVLRNATLAVRHGKIGGGNTIVSYDSAFETLLESRRKIESELRQAITDDALEVWFQPVANAITGEMHGCEALVRWRAHDGSMRRPDEFIRIAEESDLIVELDRWVIERVAKQLATWQSTPLRGLDIAVNVSARHLSDGHLARTILDAASRHAIDCNRLAIEITESYLATNLPASRRELQILHHLGVTLLIDDFGTGYCSLAYLHELPFDVLKVDRAFVEQIHHDPASASIVAALVGLGHTMGLIVLAEGVENAQQLAALQDLNCDQIQGFHVAQAMPADELAAFAVANIATRRAHAGR